MVSRLRKVAAAATAVAVSASVAVASLVTPAAADVASVDLSTYARVGRFDLPEPTRTAAPPGSLLAQEASGITYNWDTDTLFIVGDGGTSVVQVSKTGALIDSMSLAAGSSPQGTEFYDTEGIAYVGGGQFVLTEERDRRANLFTYAAGATLQRADVQTVTLGTAIGNVGIEGVTYDPQTSGFVFVKELDPSGIFQTTIDWNAGTASNGSASTVNSTDLFPPASAGLLDFSDVYALSNIPSLAGSGDEDNLLLLSQESGTVVEIDRAGVVQSSLSFRRDADNPLSIPAQTIEGVAMDRDGNLYIVNENGGGDATRPQLWVYSSTPAPNEAPTGVTLTPSTASLAENTNTATRIKLAEVTVADDADGGKGTNVLSLSGPDAASFQVDSTGLYLAPGVVLDFEVKSSYSVTVQVDDTSIGATPDASAPFTLTVTDIPNEAGVPTSAVWISEVSPGSSGLGIGYNADWFELTNAGGAAIDITGWVMNDDTNDFGSGAPLAGVTALAPGESAIFVEGTAATATNFRNAWFGGAPPAGLQIGSYTGTGVGLSTGGDAVNVFDSAGTRVAGVAFGTTPAGTSFDNTAGVSGTVLPLPTIATASVIGTNGGFRGPGSLEIGSPGIVGGRVVITEAAPWGSGNAPYAQDWIELTNVGDLPLSLSGWRMDDSSAALATSVALTGVGTLAAGESAVFLEGAAPSASFSPTWFGATPAAGLQIGSYTGSGVGLGTTGDGVTVFDAGGAVAAGITFGASTTFRTFENSAGTGGPTLPFPSVSALSVRGQHGAFVSASGAETGSPGTTAPRVSVTEVSPWSSGNAPYFADWFEITNTGAVPVDLTGWAVDDNSNSIAAAVPLRGVTTIPAGGSAAFIEGNAAGTTDPSLRSSWSEAWFGLTIPPAPLQVGFYGGASVGLSTGGDAVNLFSGLGERLTGVAFGTSTVGATFDNTAGAGRTILPLPTVATLSAVGVNGAFRAFDAVEVGSPLRDLLPPTLGACPAGGPFTLGTGPQPVGPITATDDVSGINAAASTLSGLVDTATVATASVTFTAADRAGRSTTKSCDYDVQAVPPTADAGGPYEVDEGSSISLDGTGSAAGSFPITSYSWAPSARLTGADTATPSFDAVDDGVVPVTLSVSDGTLSDDDSTDITVRNVAPSVDAGPDFLLDEPTLGVSQQVEIADPGVEDTFDAVVDWGDGTVEPYGSVSSPFQIEHTYASPGTYTVSVEVQDDDGGVGTDDFTVTIRSAIVADAGGPYVVDEGGSITLDGTGSTGGSGSIVSYSWTPAVRLTGADTASPSFSGVDDEVVAVTLTVCDDLGRCAVDSTTITVRNVAPTVVAGPDVTIGANSSVIQKISVAFTDPGTPDRFSARIDWGDGTPATVIANAFTPLLPGHLYRNPGTYTATATVTDDNGGVGVDTFTVTVLPVAVPGALTFTEGPAGTRVANVPVVLNAAPLTTVTIAYRTIDPTTPNPGGAFPGEDYLPATGTITFAPGQLVAYVPITVVGDNVNEASEGVLYQLSSPEGAILGGVAGLGGLFIANDDTPTVSVSIDTTVLEGTGGPRTQLPLTVRLSNPTAIPVSASWTTVALPPGTTGAAVAGTTGALGVDYIAKRGTARIAAGSSSVGITVPVVPDSSRELTEYVLVQVTGASNANVGTGLAAFGLGRILDDD